MIIRTSWLAGILLVSAFAAPAQDTRTDNVRAQAGEVLIGDLVGYVDACQKRKLYAERDEICAKIIELQPQNEMARKWLGHKRVRDGTWKEPRNRRAARNFDDEALVEMHAQLVRIVAAYVERLTSFYEANVAEIPPAERERLFADVLRFDPGNALVRGVRGEVRLGERWVLAETVRAAERRAELAELIRRTYAEAPKPRAVGPTETELALGIALKHSIATPIVRVHGTGAPDEPARVAAALFVTHAAFRWALGAEGNYPENFTVYMLRKPAEKASLLERHPAIDPASRDFLSQVEGAVIPDSDDFAAWAEDRNRRIDAIVRQATGWLASDGLGVTTAQGWLYEGLGLYMTQQVLGTRLNWFVRPSHYEDLRRADMLRTRLTKPGADWRRIGYYMLKDKPLLKRPILDAFLRKDLNALETAELLYAFVFTIYLVEGRPDETTEIVWRIAEGEDPGVVVEEELGLTLRALEPRVVRWLEETGAPDGDATREPRSK